MTLEKNTQHTRVSYTGVVLDEQSRVLIKQHVEIPEGWKELIHHCTLCMGSIKDRSLIGNRVEMLVTELGMSDEAMAVRVLIPAKMYKAGAFKQSCRVPHVTVAIPEGSKPFFSNRITEWKKIDTIKLTGVVTEVTAIV